MLCGPSCVLSIAGLIITSALTIWKSLMLVTGSESPVGYSTNLCALVCRPGHGISTLNVDESQASDRQRIPGRLQHKSLLKFTCTGLVDCKIDENAAHHQNLFTLSALSVPQHPTDKAGHHASINMMARWHGNMIPSPHVSRLWWYYLHVAHENST